MAGVRVEEFGQKASADLEDHTMSIDSYKLLGVILSSLQQQNSFAVQEPILEPCRRLRYIAQQLTIRTRSPVCYRRLVGAALHLDVAGGADGGARARNVLALAGLAVGLASVEVRVRALTLTLTPTTS